MSSCNQNCSSCNQSCSDRKEESLLIEKNPKSNIKKVIGVISGKGGVGKSIVTSMLAVETQRNGLQAGVLDSDIVGPSIAKVFGINTPAYGNEDGILPAYTETGIQIMSSNMMLEDPTKPVLFRGPVLAGMVKQFYSDVVWNDIDVLYVDMPPGTGDVALTVFQSIPLDGIIMVTTPQELVGMIVEKALNMATMMNIPVLGLVENMSYLECEDCHKKIEVFGPSHADEIAMKYGLEVLAKLPIDPQLAALCDAGNIEAMPFTSNLDKILEKILI